MRGLGIPRKQPLSYRTDRQTQPNDTKRRIDTLSTWKKSLYEFTKKQFELNMAGVNKALANAMGDSAREYLDNLIGQQVEDILKGMVDEALRGCPEPEEMVGKWTGTTTFTVINMPSPEKAKEEGCDLDFSSALKELKGKAIRAEDHYEINGTARITFGSSTQQIAYMGGTFKVTKK